MQELTDWLDSPDPEVFPYDAVVAEFHRVGKHFVDPTLLSLLDSVRANVRGTDPSAALLARFLNIALDKRDGRFDNPSYLALEMLPLPGTGVQHDRLRAMLLADVLAFELAGAHRVAAPEEMRPHPRVVVKRCRLAVRAIMPVLERLGLSDHVDSRDTLTAARQICHAVEAKTTDDERRVVALSMLPVSIVHDERMFIRVLQSYETTFALVGVHLTTAVAALAHGRSTDAIDAVHAAERAMREAAPLFSLAATMQAESFLTFRNFTEGASAIQSRNYKLIESLCRRPEPARLDSAAYHSVPEVRDAVLTGAPNLDRELNDAYARGNLAHHCHTALVAGMHRFETALVKWRKTHYRLAVRMLGDRRGTGYTEGVPYLDQARSIPVFGTTVTAGRRCPFAA